MVVSRSTTEALLPLFTDNVLIPRTGSVNRGFERQVTPTRPFCSPAAVLLITLRAGGLLD